MAAQSAPVFHHIHILDIDTVHMMVAATVLKVIVAARVSIDRSRFVPDYRLDDAGVLWSRQWALLLDSPKQMGTTVRSGLAIDGSTADTLPF